MTNLSTQPGFTALQQRLEETLLLIERSGVVQIPGHPPCPLEYQVDPDEGRLLRDLVVQSQAHSTLEVGLGTGMSGLYICWGLLRNGGGCHLAIDPFQAGPFWQSRGLALRDHLGLSFMFHWDSRPDDQALPDLLARHYPVDLAFIDGDHRFDAALLDFYYIDRLLQPGGLCVFDDADWPSVWRVVQFALRHRHYQVQALLPLNLGPWTRPWSWRLRWRRLQTFRRQRWPLREALWRHPVRMVALRKISSRRPPEPFWDSLERYRLPTDSSSVFACSQESPASLSPGPAA